MAFEKHSAKPPNRHRRCNEINHLSDQRAKQRQIIGNLQHHRVLRDIDPSKT